MTAKVVVNGAAGRMGRLVAADLRRAGFARVVGCDAKVETTLILEDGPLECAHDLLTVVDAGGVVVDFSHPDATPTLVRAARERGARLVVGTTGQSPQQLQILHEAARQVPVVLARNFSLGINRLAQVLPLLRVLTTDGFDVECLEGHHRQKRDAPSGTAMMLLEALLGADASARTVHGRHGCETLRRTGEVGVHSLRLGQLAGEHTLLLASDHEVVEIRHRALDRSAFVTGVAPAVHFVLGQTAGLYSMLDVMGHADVS